uniref:Uncharacterized protein n=1 Tax=Aplanochytrium stocchinoi TaxID=215587 RepID=A0A7S3V026_9STRA|mmetsp:Transcript_18392/g.22525  ORF Transcript_18392/g.22525 Transcript_18392/m.22525 type:complete len:109 (+) Transcript_18392:278-604(+)
MDIVYKREVKVGKPDTNWEKCGGNCEQFYHIKFSEGKMCKNCKAWLCSRCSTIGGNICIECRHHDNVNTRRKKDALTFYNSIIGINSRPKQDMASETKTVDESETNQE